MSVHVLLEKTFFATTVPVGDQQRMMLIPAGRGLHVGDNIFLRDDAGELTWTGDVLAVGEIDGVGAWSNKNEGGKQRHALIGYLARLHPGTLPRGTSKLSARWVTLNRRTLPGTLPWWGQGILVYHSTLRLVEGLLSPEQVQEASERGYLNRHPSGLWTIPHGEARKRLMVHILGVELTCGLCGGDIAALEETTQDHIIPTSQGGPDTLANVQLAHRSCNELKGNALPEQYPPFFPQPGDSAAGWYGRYGRRGRGRNGRPRRRRNTPPTAGFQVETRDVPDTNTAPDKPERVEQNTDRPTPQREKPAAKRASNDRAENTTQRDERSADNDTAPLPPEDAAWLDTVRAASLDKLHTLSQQANWAARTAALRTLEQLPRNRAASARNEGALLAEARGPKGRFRLLDWKDAFVLVEERGRRQTLHVAQMVDALSADAYVSYLSQFGRTSPLAVAMTLLPLWQKGKADDEGRLEATRNGRQLTLVVDDMRIEECSVTSSAKAAERTAS